MAHAVTDRIARRHPLYEPACRMTELVRGSDPIVHHTFDAGEGVLALACETGDVDQGTFPVAFVRRVARIGMDEIAAAEGIAVEDVLARLQLQVGAARPAGQGAGECPGGSLPA